MLVMFMILFSLIYIIKITAAVILMRGLCFSNFGSKDVSIWMFIVMSVCLSMGALCLSVTMEIMGLVMLFPLFMCMNSIFLLHVMSLVSGKPYPSYLVMIFICVHVFLSPFF